MNLVDAVREWLDASDDFQNGYATTQEYDAKLARYRAAKELARAAAQDDPLLEQVRINDVLTERLAVAEDRIRQLLKEGE